MSDPFSEILSLVDVRAARCKRFEAGRPFAMQFPTKPALKFAAVLSGACWIIIAGEDQVRLSTNDTFLLSDAPTYVLASDPALAPEDGYAAYDSGGADAVSLDGADLRIVSAEFNLRCGSADVLLDALPAFIHIPGQTVSAAVLRQTLSLLDYELAESEMGHGLMTKRLAEIALIQILRFYAHQNQARPPQWLRALADPKIAVALQYIHERPSHHWTVGELATRSGMSRSVFAKRFGELVGVPPLEYVTRWRLEQSRDALLQSGKDIAHISEQAGYASESAFRTAFKRAFGVPPGRYRRQVTNNKLS